MQDLCSFYIGGQWVEPRSNRKMDVINPATEKPCARISMGNQEDIDRAVSAAREAFQSFSMSPKDERLALLKRILECYQERYSEIAEAITQEMGAPVTLSNELQAAIGVAHLGTLISEFEDYAFSQQKGSTYIVKEPIGVCGFITPWNWPINQVIIKVAPAIAAGCTMVVKPSEQSPLSAYLLAEVMASAGVPDGVFNLVNGDSEAGQALAEHGGVDMISFTGSTRGGIAVAKAAADSVKRVAQELGGKSANIILDDVDLAQVVTASVQACFLNSGQSCNAPTRMLVPHHKMAQAAEVASATAAAMKVGDPVNKNTILGPVVSKQQWNNIQNMIEKGISEGATLACGGMGLPEGLEQGFFVRPTIFSDVTNDMAIAQQEIFGPVLCIIGYENVDEAVRIANDSDYGLAAYIKTADINVAQDIAAKLRVGMVYINDAGLDFTAPFGGYKMSGNGREWGLYGLEELLETKVMIGYSQA